MMKRLSIIIPVYKAEKYIQECVNSILPQLSDEDELILVDDGTSDHSGAICDIYASKYDNCVVIHQENRGVSNARSAGIRNAKGRLLMFVDSDDALTEDAIKTLQPYFSDTEWDLLIFGNIRIKNGNATESKPSATQRYEKKSFSEVYGSFCKKFLISSPCNKVYKTNILQGKDIIFDENLSLGEDLLFNNAVLRVTSNIQLLAKAIYVYYERKQESLTRRYYSNLFEIYQRLYNDTRETFLSIGGEEKNSGEIKELYYQQLKYGICNIWNDRNSEDVKRKLKQTKTALNSKELRECLPYARKKDTLWILLFLKWVIMVRLYIFASHWKGHRR